VPGRDGPVGIEQEGPLLSTTPPWSRRARRQVAAAVLVVLVATTGCGAARFGSGSTALAETRGVGVFRKGGTTPATVAEWERFIGRRVTHVSSYFSEESFPAMIEHAAWKARQFQGSGKTLVAGVPLAGRGLGSLASGAAGAHDAQWRQLASTLVANGQPNAILRLGWEFNGDWFAWSARSNPGTFASYFRRIVTTMRSVPGAGGLRFDWNPGIGPAFVPEAAYPGDAYVDVIGLDIYDRSYSARVANSEARWADFMDRPYGLRWHRDFARAHGKPMSFPEWGVTSADKHVAGATADNASFVNHLADWMAVNDVAYQSYFDVDKPGDGSHALMTGRFPASADAYRTRF
jgi:hypothetical protein